MKTLKNKNYKTKTKKHKNLNPSFKILRKGFSLYASKKSYGDKILEYTKEQEDKYNDSCLMGNISWFGDLEEAKAYKTKELNIYKWTIDRPANLLIMNKKNEEFFMYYFNNTSKQLYSAIELNNDQIKKAKLLLEKENIVCPYLELSLNERAFYEFKFAYGYITVNEQYEFMKLVKFLIENKFMEIKTREGTSILLKLKEKIDYYYLFSKINKKIKYNRLSIYLFDKFALNNLCKIIPTHYKVSGVIQKNEKSFWFPKLFMHKMNIKEYVLYNPHHNLIYDKMIE